MWGHFPSSLPDSWPSLPIVMEFSLQYLRYIYIMDMSQLVTHKPRRIAKILKSITGFSFAWVCLNYSALSAHVPAFCHSFNAICLMSTPLRLCCVWEMMKLVGITHHLHSWWRWWSDTLLVTLTWLWLFWLCQNWHNVYLQCVILEFSLRDTHMDLCSWTWLIVLFVQHTREGDGLTLRE
jgi:hypothetical protein